MSKSASRSSIYKDIFIDDEMIQAFGKLNPSITERTSYFFDLWMQWRSYRIKFDIRINSSHREEIKTKLKHLGLRELWDYQLKNNEIRFKDAESMAFFKIITGGN